MKIRNFFATLALALSLGIGALFSVSHVSEAKADTEETTFYVDVRDSLWGYSNIGEVKIHLYGESTGDVWIYDAETGLSTIVVDEVTYVSFSIASHSGVTGFDVYCWSHGPSAGNYTVWTEFSAFSEGQNLITVGSSGDWSVSNPVTLGTLSLGTTYTITQYAVYDGVVDYDYPLGTAPVVAGQPYESPVRPYKDNYYCYGWYSDEKCTEVWDDEAPINVDTPIYACFEFHGPWAGTVAIDLSYKENATGWATGDSGFALYLATADWNHTGWSSFAVHKDGEGLVEVDYSVPFTPYYSIIVKYPSSVTEEIWTDAEDKWEIKDAQSANLYFDNNYTLCQGDEAYVERGIPSIESGVIGGESWYTIGSLGQVQLNGSKHTEYFGSVYLPAGEEEEVVAFKVLYAANGWYGNATWHASLADNFENDSDGNIIIKVTGTYMVYFDTFSGSVYITTENLADADEWSKLFLAGVTCDGDGNITSEDWKGLSEIFGHLSAGAKAVFLDIAKGGKQDGTYTEQAVARYDYIINKYGTEAYEDFMGRDGTNGISYPVTVNSVEMFYLENGNSSAMLITVISVVALASLSTVAILIVIKKRKHN